MYEDYLKKSLANIIEARHALYEYKRDSSNLKYLKHLASYNVQQTIEILMKYCIYNNPDYCSTCQVYSHDLSKLINTYCIPQGIYVPDRIKRNSALYTTWEAESRYS